MAAKPDIVAGTITLTTGSATFTGTDTFWMFAGGIGDGDTIIDVTGATEFMGVIQSIESNTSGTLSKPWEGPTVTADYRIRFMADGQKVTAQARNLIELLGNGRLTAIASAPGAAGVFELLPGGGVQLTPKTDLVSGVDVDARVQTLSERAAFDGQPEQFSVYVNDIGGGIAAVYFKKSNASADWSTPAIQTGAASTVPGVVWRGTYSGATAYAINDGVTFNGSSFRKLTTAAAGTAPSSATPPVNTAAWEVLAAKGATGDITGVTTFWNARITGDTTAAQARAGLGALGFGSYGIGTVYLGPFAPAGYATADLTPQQTATLVGAAGFYSFVSLAGGPIQMPPGFPQTYGVIRGYTDFNSGLTYSWQEFTGSGGNRKWMRRAVNTTTWGAWSEVYHTGNILGTVSQTAGVPTGAIIESGSNANGVYVRYANGTQICSGVVASRSIAMTTAYGAIFRYASQVVLDFPVSFSGSMPFFTSSSSNAITISHGSSLTQGFYYMCHPLSFTQNLTDTWFAVGKWF